MRCRKVIGSALMVGLFVLPVAVSAIDTTTPAQIEGAGTDTSGTSTSSSTQYLNFDPSKNVIGKGTTKVVDATGSINRITFLSGGKDPVSIAINIVNVALGVLGLASLIMMSYAGILWFSARDNEEQITKAKDVLIGAVVGLVLTLLAFGLGQLLFDQLYTVTGGV